MIGLLCHDSLELVGHSMFQNYRMALKNFFPNEAFKDINTINDIEGISHLYIVDEHFHPNRDVWSTKQFINSVNEQNVKVIIFNFDKIYNSPFPWNIDNQNAVNSFKNVTQFVADIDDANLLNKTILNKFYLSKSMVFNVEKKPKKDVVLFLGRFNQNEYSKRADMLRKLNGKIPLEIISTDRKLTYQQYLQTLSEYKYALCPLGVGKFICLRFFEAIRLGTIPVQQMLSDMYYWYDELKDSGLFFTEPHDLQIEDKQIKEIFLEEYLDYIKLSNYM